MQGRRQCVVCVCVCVCVEIMRLVVAKITILTLVCAALCVSSQEEEANVLARQFTDITMEIGALQEALQRTRLNNEAKDELHMQMKAAHVRLELVKERQQRAAQRKTERRRGSQFINRESIRRSGMARVVLAETV